MMRKAFAIAAALGALALPALASASTGAKHPEAQDWSFNGPFGKFDQAQLQRGFKVYREVCSSCHGMSLLSYRNLGQKGGPFWNAKYENPNENPWAKAIAKDVQVPDIDSETGDVIQRPATPADRFKSPFANEAAARASNGGAFPPDLSVIAKARVGGPDYIHALLSGYAPAPKGLTVPTGKYYNPYLPGDLSSFWTGDPKHVPQGGFIAMPPPLTAGQVTFDDNTPSTVDQQSKDVSAFLMWAAEPKMEERKKMGFGVMIYLLLLAGVVYASYRHIWKNVAH